MRPGRSATSTSSCCTTGAPSTTTEVTELADRLWYPIWDAGARLDHSVRTVTQCRSVASGDLAAAVGLLDLTWVAGDQEVVTATRATLAHDWRGNARKRLPQLIESDRGAARPPRRPGPDPRAGPEGGPGRAARHDRAAGADGRVAGRPPARRHRPRLRLPAGRPGRRPRGHRPWPRPARQGGPRQRRRPARPARLRHPADRGGHLRPDHRLRPGRDRTPRRAVPAGPHPAGRPAPAAADAPGLRPVRARRRDRARRLGRPVRRPPAGAAGGAGLGPAEPAARHRPPSPTWPGRRRCRRRGRRWPSRCSATCWPPGPG